VVLLNLVFSVGIISVFLVLATLAAFFQLGWGGLYQQLGFTVLMISVVFVFGLSFLGVWEIPIPGFSGGSGGGQKEGLFAAFFKGVLTTFLATPCSGPLLVPAVVWAMAQPMLITYLVFFAMGVGMAAPYLLLGLFPQLVRTLPRPGNWMEVFKQLMGFVLMAAVVFFLSAVPEKYETSMLSLLVFLSIACWLVGHISIAAETSQKIRSWAFALAIAGFGVYFSFFLLIPRHELNWQPYSKAKLNELLEAGQPVFVDFTAEWCGTCKTNERLALNSKLMKSYFEERGVVTLKADFTESLPEGDELLKALGNEATAIPYYAYYPQGAKSPVHFNGLFLTPQSFLDKLKSEETLQKQTAKTEQGSSLKYSAGSTFQIFPSDSFNKFAACSETVGSANLLVLLRWGSLWEWSLSSFSGPRVLDRPSRHGNFPSRSSLSKPNRSRQPRQTDF
jgi:thiol:disulfide interchange protein DsbD